MEKVLIILTLIFCINKSAISQNLSISIASLNPGAAIGEAGFNDLIKVSLTKEAGTSFPEEPYSLVLNSLPLGIAPFHIDLGPEGNSKYLYFRLDEKELIKYIKGKDGKFPVILQLSDKGKTIFPVNILKPNLTLLIPPKRLELVDTVFRLDRPFRVMAIGASSISELPDEPSKIGLYFNDILVSNARVLGRGLSNDTLTFAFGLDSAGMTRIFYKNDPEEYVSVGIGPKDKSILSTEDSKKLKILFMRPNGKPIFWGITIVLALIMYLLCRFTNLIKDGFLVGDYRPYSLGRTQFAIWTFIIIISLLYIWFTTKEMAAMPSSVFILLGISATVTLAAWFIDGFPDPNENTGRKAHVITKAPDTTEEKKEEKEGKRDKEYKIPQFIRDLISDASGVSIHRLQNLLFTLFYASFFWWEVFNHLELPAFNNNLLALLGVSGAAYTAMKKGEGGGGN